jgi:transcriptional antiterminator NusG
MKKWYVVQVVAGNEEAFRRDLLKVIQDQDMDMTFGIGEVMIPTRKKNPTDVDGEKVFPGYVFIQADVSVEGVVSLISKVPRFHKFVGGMPPVPLREKEVRNIFENANKLLKGADSTLLIGGEVKVVKGPFTGFVGIVESVGGEDRRVRLSVSIFGRMTSVAVDLDQLEA